MKSNFATIKQTAQLYEAKVLCFSMLLVFASWFNADLIILLNKVFQGGVIIIPFSLMLLSNIAQTFGQKKAYKALLISLCFIAFNFAYERFARHLPNPGTLILRNKPYSQFLHSQIEMIVSYTIAILIASTINISISRKIITAKNTAIKTIVIGILSTIIYVYLSHLIL